jgi:transposase
MVMVREKYGVKLAPEERERLEGLVRSGKSPARVMARARILLKTGEGWKAPKVAEALDVSEGTVYRSKQRFAGEGLERALRDRRQANRHRKLDDRGEAHLVALACSPAPEGHERWTLRLLAGKVVELGLASSMSHEGVRKRLKKTPSNRGRRRSGASPR